MPRRSSFGSDSEHSHSHKRSRSCVDTPVPSSAKSVFRQSFDFARTRTSSPVVASPVLQNSRSSSQHSAIKPSPLHTEAPVRRESLPPIDDEVLLSTWDWTNMGPSNVNPDFTPQFTFNPAGFPPQMQAAYGNWQGFESQQLPLDSNLMNVFTNQTPGALTNVLNQQWQDGLSSQQEQQQQQPMDFDFSKFVQIAT